MKKVFVLLFAAVLALAGCGDGSSAAPAPTASCVQRDTEELYVQRLYDCRDTLLYTFTDSSARDDWTKIATHYGTTVMEQGPTWVRVSIAKPGSWPSE
jgi:hypothetical protein